MNTTLLIIALLLIGGIWLYEILVGSRDVKNRRDGKYTIKIISLHCQRLVALVFAVYWVLIMVNFLIIFNKHIAVTYPPTSIAALTMPMAFATFIILGILLIVYYGFKPLWRFTENERAYRQAQRQQRKNVLNQKLQTYPKIIRWILKS